jgi:tetratricopeptide (TPR) repeat protein
MPRDAIHNLRIQVAQVFNPLYRRLEACGQSRSGKFPEGPSASRWQIGDTAGCKPAIRLWAPAIIVPLFLFCVLVHSAEAPSYPAPTLDQAHAFHTFARSNYINAPTNTAAAWTFAEACFEWAEYATNDTQRAALAEEGIAAAAYTIRHAPKNVGGHFYLAMNKGQLARTRTLGALPLVKEMEQAFLRAIELDPKFENAAAHRSLGMLYLDAPGWPASIGSKSKARRHLERAVVLAPDYPTNHLALMDAYLRWKDTSALRAAMTRYRRLLPAAKQQYTGEKWKNSWKIWEKDWKRILERSVE